MKLVRTIKLRLQEDPQVFQPTINAYTKGPMYCVLIIKDGKRVTHKYPLATIFRVIEDYNKSKRPKCEQFEFLPLTECAFVKPPRTITIQGLDANRNKVVQSFASPTPVQHTLPSSGLFCGDYHIHCPFREVDIHSPAGFSGKCIGSKPQCELYIATGRSK